MGKSDPVTLHCKTEDCRQKVQLQIDCWFSIFFQYLMRTSSLLVEKICLVVQGKRPINDDMKEQRGNLNWVIPSKIALKEVSEAQGRQQSNIQFRFRFYLVLQAFFDLYPYSYPYSSKLNGFGVQD